jgi:Rieske 2Fe-2S family protein
VCPYHRWTYGVDGRLKAAPGARNGRDFKFEDWKLHEAHCDTYFGAIFVYLADEAPSETVDQLLTKLTVFKDKLKDLQLERTKIAARRVYTMSCNWKTILENAGECYHCPGGHPSLVNAVNVPATYLTDDGRVNTGGKDVLFPFNDGMKTISADGDWVCRKPLGKAQVEQFSAGYQLYPNFIGASFYSDYGTIIVIEPISVNKTRMFCEWFVHEDAVEGVDYDLERLIQVWDKTNKEDVELAERNYKGLQSVRFKPGPHVMNREGIVRMVLMSYLDMMNAPAVGSGA